MTNVDFSMGQIGNEPRIRDFIGSYEREMKRRGFVNNWPNSDIFHVGALFVNDEPLTMALYAPLEDKWRAVYSSGAYTRPSWRHCGFYADLMEILINQWRKEDKYDWFLSGYDKKNWISQKVQRAREGTEEYEEVGGCIRTRLSLRPTGLEFELDPILLEPILAKVERLTL